MSTKIVIVNIILLFTMILRAQTDNYYEEILLPYDPPFWGFFGNKLNVLNNQVAISGNPNIYLFINNQDTSWTEYQMIDEPNACNFGVSVSSDEDILIVGSSGSVNYCPYNNGEVYIYERENDLWVRDTILVSFDEDVFKFGYGVCVNGDLIAIAARMGNAAIYDGLVYLYRSINGVWINEDILSYEGVEDVAFAINLLIDDSTIYVIGKYDSGEYIVYIYEQTENGWEIINNIIPQISIENIGFGSSLYRTGEYLLVGAPGTVSIPSFTGQVYVFQLADSLWQETQILTPNDAEAGDRFGCKIAGSGNQIVVGAYNNDDAGTGSGSAYIFELISDQWVETKKIIPSDAVNGDLFGTEVSMNEDFVFIGAPDKNNLEGAVYVYDPHDTTLHANFAGDVRNGNAPVTVQFTSVPQGNPTAYAWDFNSDGFVDSTEPHPQFTYQINGIYTVTLTVYDETGSDDEVKADYIQVVSDILFGDVDQSGDLDVGDLVLFVAFVLGDAEPTEDQFLAGDVNYSGQIDIIDIVMVIHEILN